MKFKLSCILYSLWAKYNEESLCLLLLNKTKINISTVRELIKFCLHLKAVYWVPLVSDNIRNRQYIDTLYITKMQGGEYCQSQNDTES